MKNLNYETKVEVILTSSTMQIEEAQEDSSVFFNLLIRIMTFKRTRKLKYFFQAIKLLWKISKKTDVRIVTLSKTKPELDKVRKC